MVICIKEYREFILLKGKTRQIIPAIRDQIIVLKL